jgi:hypothetical protein
MPRWSRIPFDAEVRGALTTLGIEVVNARERPARTVRGFKRSDLVQVRKPARPVTDREAPAHRTAGITGCRERQDERARKPGARERAGADVGSLDVERAIGMDYHVDVLDDRPREVSRIDHLHDLADEGIAIGLAKPCDDAAGVLEGAGGVIVTAPGALQRFWAEIVGWLRSGWRWVLHHWPWHHPPAQTIYPTGIGSAGVVGHATMTAEGYAWPTAGSTDDRVEVLRKRSDALEVKIRQLRSDHDQRLHALSAEIAKLHSSHRQELAKISAELAAREQKAAMIDATGLPVIGAAIVLSGVPDTVLRHSTVSIALLVSAGIVSVTAFGLWRGAHRHRPA